MGQFINLTAADLASLVNSDSQNNRNEIQKRAIAVIDLDDAHCVAAGEARQAKACICTGRRHC